MGNKAGIINHICAAFVFLSDALLLEASKKAVKHIKPNDGISLGGYTLPKMSYLEFRAKKKYSVYIPSNLFFSPAKMGKMPNILC